ncbi:PREDICTED: antigen KI-67 [Dipodomys ordii]|uniref:Antigen KI-67 n=1 Tax=Dipodomys ordii TaxID=10020 RepID=A0A1S3FLX7_DIPOR|nr:PREDICTED: antigen KI-67 [Dipodomys ordii]
MTASTEADPFAKNTGPCELGHKDTIAAEGQSLVETGLNKDMAAGILIQSCLPGRQQRGMSSADAPIPGLSGVQRSPTKVPNPPGSTPTLALGMLDNCREHGPSFRIYVGTKEDKGGSLLNPPQREGTPRGWSGNHALRRKNLRKKRRKRRTPGMQAPPPGASPPPPRSLPGSVHDHTHCARPLPPGSSYWAFDRNPGLRGRRLGACTPAARGRARVRVRSRERRAGIGLGQASTAATQESGDIVSPSLEEVGPPTASPAEPGTARLGGASGHRRSARLRGLTDIECDIRIQLPVVSKLHCRIEVSGQEATLYNFSSTNPTQLNGSAIDKPVHLKHGDVITIIDRSFRYEKESPQNESKPDEFPGKRQEQARARRSSRSSLSTPPDGKAQGSRTHSKVTASRSQEPGKELMGDSATPDGSEHRAAPQLLHACSPEQVGNDGGKAGRPTPRGPKENSRVTASPCGDLKSLPSAQSFDSSKDTESPFEKLYQSMKEELSLSLQKQSLAQTRRKSGLQLDSATEKERRENLPWGSHKARPRSADTLCIKAASPFTPETNQTQEKGISADPAHTSDQALNSSISVAETTTKSPGRFSQPRKDTGPYITGGEAVNLGPGEGIGSADRPVTPRRRLTGNRPSAIAGATASPAGQPDSLSSRSRSVPAEAERPSPEVRKEPFVTQCFPRTESKIPKDFLDEPNKLAVKSGQIGSGLPGLSSVDISNFGDSINKSEGASLKRRRVSFGGRLRPELFDENLPPNTPLKRGETPSKRKLPVTHTPAVLKKIIKEQPPSGEEESSEICVEVTAQDVCTGAVASSPGVTQPGVNGQRRRSGKASTASGVGGSPGQTDTPKRAGRKSAGSSSKRTSISRGQHDILQRICSKRRSGASEANLIVAKSWADVVKLGAKQTQVRVPKHGPPKPVGRRQRKPSTPKKPTASVCRQFSTGHANSPCTIVIGKAQTEKVSIPARPSRMLSSFVFNRKMDYSEDLSGITELFKTPVKEKPQTTGPGSFTLSSPENLTGKQFQAVNSGENPLCTTSETWVFSSQNSAREPSDKCSESHTIKQQSREDRSTAKTPQNMPKTTHPERKTPDAVKEPLNTVPSASRLRQSRELRSSQTPPVRSKNGGTEGPPAEGVTDTSLRKTPLRVRKVEGEDSAGSAETGRERDKSTESSAKVTTVRRSRSEGQKLGPKELLGTPAHAKEPENEADQTTGTDSSSQGADLTNTRKRPPKTEDSNEDAPHMSHQPTHTNLTPSTPRPHGDPAACAARVKKGSRTPKKQTQPLEDLVGFAELFQTPGQPMAHEKAKVPRKSPQPMPTSTKAQPVTPSRKMDASELSALRKFAHMSVGDTHTLKVTQPDVTSIRALKEPAKQIVHPVGNVTGSKRQQETPKEKTQLEDLAGFQELLQTPGLSKDLVITDRTTKRTREAPQATTARTPGSTQRQPRTRVGNMDVKAVSSLRKLQQSPGKALQTPTAPEEEELSTAFVQTPEQTPDMTGDLTGSKRRSRTSKGRNRSKDSKTVNRTTEVSGRAPEPVRTPAGVRRQPRPSRGNDVEEEPRKQRPRSPSEAAKSSPEVTQSKAALGESTVQTPHTVANRRDRRKQPRAPKERSQPLEDLSGLQELFRTPGHPKDSIPMEITGLPGTSPQSEPGRPSRPSLGTLRVKEELPAPQEMTEVLEETTHTHRVPDGEVTVPKAGEVSARPARDPVRRAGSRLRRMTPKEKAQPLEDLSGLQELFQTPGHPEDPVPRAAPQPPPTNTPATAKRRARASLGKAPMDGESLGFSKLPHKSGEPTRTPQVPGGEDGARVVKPRAKRKLDPADSVTGSKSKRLRGVPEKAPSPDDQAGLQELLETKDTNTPRQPPQPEPQDTSVPLKRATRTRRGTVDMQEELPAAKTLTHASRQATRTRKVLEGKVTDIQVSKESTKQVPDPAKSITGTRKLRGARKESTQPLDSLAASNETIQPPAHTENSGSDASAGRIPPQSPQPEPDTNTASRRPLRTRRGNAVVSKETSGPARETRKTAGKPMLSGEGVTMLEEPLQPELAPAARVARPKRLRGAAAEKAPPLDPASLPEALQAPAHTEDPADDEKSTNTPHQPPQPEPQDTSVPSKRATRSQRGTVDTKEELPAAKTLTRASRQTTRTRKVLEGDVTDSQASKESAKQALDPANNVTGTRRLRGARKESTQPLGGPASPKETVQPPAHTEELTNSAVTPKPLKTSRRVLRAPKEKPVTSLIPKQEPGEDGPGVQSSVTTTPASSEEKPAIRQRPRPPRPLKMLKCLRVLAPKIHLGEEQSCNSTETEDGEPREAPAAANQRMSLRTRHPQNPRAGQQSSEGLGSAEKVTEKRNAKKPEKTSQDTEPQSQENGGQQPATRGRVRGGRGGLRSGGQSKASAPLPAEDKVKESQESSSRGQNESGARPDVRGLRAKRTAIQPAGSTLDSEPKPRVTRGAKRGAENPKKADDTVSSKRVRSRRPRDGEDV